MTTVEETPFGLRSSGQQAIGALSSKWAFFRAFDVRFYASWPGGSWAVLWSSLGSFLAIPLAISGILDSTILHTLLRALGLIAVSTAAYFLAYMTTIGMQLNFPQIVPSAERWDMCTREPASPIALLAGGLVGGFVIFAGLTYLPRPEINKGFRTRKIIHGALLGGVLGIAGWALRSSIGVATWNLFHAIGLTPPWELSPREWFHDTYDYGQRSRMYSLYIVWQTGVAAATGVMLRHHFRRREDKPDHLHLSNS